MSEPANREETIFEHALGLVSAEARETYVRGACGGDLALRERILGLLQAHERAGRFLEPRPPADERSPPRSPDENRTVREASPGEEPADRIGRYKLLQKIGEGGCGIVYMAEQHEPVRRRVALKVIKLGMDTRHVVARFEAERQALALMDHPNIARVFDGGSTETGRPYFVMELVRGVRITGYCDQRQLSVHERLELFVQVCRAIQHAHQKGIVHRDIKPSNILVMLHDDKPVPKVIDFGIAKALEQPLTDKTVFTAFEQFIGTPAYMSPEQAGLSGLDIDTRSDIYALGVLLYELLTGHTPFETKELLAAGVDELRRTIREKEPTRPSTRLRMLRQAESSSTAQRRRTDAPKLIHLLHGDLDWIVMRCLEKDRSRRYETANGLARDVERYLGSEPIMARPPSRFYRFQKLVRRNKGLFAAVGAVVAALAIGLGVSLISLHRETEAHRLAQVAEQQAQARLWEAYLAQARANRYSGRAGRRFESLEALTKAAAMRAAPELRNEAIACLALTDVRVAKRLPEEPAYSPIGAIDPQYSRYARVDRSGVIRVRKLSDDFLEATLPGFGYPGVCLWFSADGASLAAKYDPPGGGIAGNVLRIWDLQLQHAVLSLTNANDLVPFAWHPRLARAALGYADGTVVLYAMPEGNVVQRFSVNVRPYRLAFSRDGGQLAVSSRAARTVVVLDLATGALRRTLPHPAGVFGVAWHPDGQLVAVGCEDRQLYLWDMGKEQPVATLSGHKAEVVTVAFSPDGELLASYGWDSMSCLWHPFTHELLLRAPSRGANLQFQFHPSGPRLGLIQEGDTLNVLELATSRPCRPVVLPVKTNVNSGTFSADGRILALATHEGTVLWDVHGRRQAGHLAPRPPHTAQYTVQFTADGRNLLISGAGVQRWPIRACLKSRSSRRESAPLSWKRAGRMSRLTSAATRFGLSRQALTLWPRAAGRPASATVR